MAFSKVKRAFKTITSKVKSDKSKTSASSDRSPPSSTATQVQDDASLPCPDSTTSNQPRLSKTKRLVSKISALPSHIKNRGRDMTLLPAVVVNAPSTTGSTSGTSEWSGQTAVHNIREYYNITTSSSESLRTDPRLIDISETHEATLGPQSNTSDVEQTSVAMRRLSEFRSFSIMDLRQFFEPTLLFSPPRLGSIDITSHDHDHLLQRNIFHSDNTISLISTTIADLETPSTNNALVLHPIHIIPTEIEQAQPPAQTRPKKATNIATTPAQQFHARRTVNHLHENIEQLETEKARVEPVFRQLNDQNSLLQDTMAVLASENQVLNHNDQVHRQNEVIYASENTRLNRKVVGLESELTHVYQALSFREKSQAELQKAYAEIDRLREVVSKDTRSLKEAEHIQKQWFICHQDLNQRLEHAKTQEKSQQDRIERLEKEHADLLINAEEAENDARLWTRHTSDAEEERDDLHQECEELKQNITKKDTETESFKNQAKRQATMISRLEDEVNDLKENLEDANTNIRHLLAKRTANTPVEESCKQPDVDAESEMNTVKDAKQCIGHLQQQVIRLTSEKNQTADHTEALQEKLNISDKEKVLLSKLVEDNGTCRVRSSDNGTSTDKCQHLTKLTVARTDHHESTIQHESQVKVLQSQLDDMTTQCHQATRDFMEADSNAHNLNTELSQVKSAYEELKEHYETEGLGSARDFIMSKHEAEVQKLNDYISDYQKYLNDEEHIKGYTLADLDAANVEIDHLKAQIQTLKFTSMQNEAILDAFEKECNFTLRARKLVVDTKSWEFGLNEDQIKSIRSLNTDFYKLKHGEIPKEEFSDWMMEPPDSRVRNVFMMNPVVATAETSNNVNRMANSSGSDRTIDSSDGQHRTVENGDSWMEHLDIRGLQEQILVMSVSMGL